MQNNTHCNTPLFLEGNSTQLGTTMLDTIWREFLKIVNEEEGSRIVETWFKAVTFVHWDPLSATANLQAPNKFVKDWVSLNYLTIIQEHLARLLNTRDIKVVFQDQATSLVPATKTTLSPAEAAPTLPCLAAELVPAKVVKNRGFLNQNYSFETLVVGPSNSFAFTAARAVAQKPGKFCNPFFVYGASGLGKTHLLHAIGNDVKEHNKRARVLYQPASRFVNEFINAIKCDKVAQFETKFKELDVLLIDDIQSIAHKEQTQEAFFHIFNVLYDEHKQIVFSCDTYPKDMRGIEERLRSRFEWGLIADIAAPQLETKIAIVRKKAELANHIIPDAVAEFIASCSYNIRVLEGSLIRIIAFASLTKQEVTLELAQKVLAREREKPKTVVTFEMVAKEVGRYYQLSLADLRSSSRCRDLALARQVAMYVMKELCGRSLHEIGVFLRRKNHSTVLHACNKIQEYAQTGSETWRAIEEIKKNLL